MMTTRCTAICCALIISLVYPSVSRAQESKAFTTADQTFLYVPVYFTAPDKSALRVEPGTYRVEAAEEWLRLLPGNDRREAILIRAHKRIHEGLVENPTAINFPGDESEDNDVHLIQFLNPDQSSLVAIGSYSGKTLEPSHRDDLLAHLPVIREQPLPDPSVEEVRSRGLTSSFSYFNESTKPGGITSASSTPQSWLTTAAADWMKKLPDRKGLSLISIPGTHDSATYKARGSVRTQTWSITKQLVAGVRFLDIRTRRTGKSFAIHHGAFFVDMMFGSVMDEVTAFLQKHPKEVILMRVKGNETTAAPNSSSIKDIWNAYMKQYDRYVYKGSNTLPTLGQARGKIVVLRDGLKGISTGYGVQYSAQDIQDKYIVMFAVHKYNSGSKVTLASKKDVIRAHISKARKWTNTKTLVLNYLSGAGGMTPRSVATVTNAVAYGAMSSGGARVNHGVIIMDYPGEKLVYRVIKSNFVTGRACNPKKFRSQSHKTWVEFRLPKSREGTVINIKGGAYAKYHFPRCHRVYWSHLRFRCESNRIWKKLSGRWGADALCHGSRGNSRWVATGRR